MEALGFNSNAGSSSKSTTTRAGAQSSAPLDFFRKATFDGSAKTCVSAGIGAAFRSAGMALAWTFFGLASGMLASRLVINLAKAVDPSKTKELDELSKKAWDYLNKNPAVRIIGFLFAAVIASFSPVVAFLTAMILGAVTGLTIDYEQCSKRQKVLDADERSEGIGDILQQWV